MLIRTLPFPTCRGYIAAPSSYLRYLRKVCDDNKILLVIDEVQSGYGRTGKFFNIEYTPDVKPDLMIFAKGLANGFPLSGVATSKEIMSTMAPGSLGGTYAGNAVACAAAGAVLDVVRRFFSLLGLTQADLATLLFCSSLRRTFSATSTLDPSRLSRPSTSSPPRPKRRTSSPTFEERAS